MKFFSIDASPLRLLLGGLLVFSLPASCGHSASSALRQLDLLRRHRTSVDDPAQRELIVRGKATPAGSAARSPSGRSCIAWSHSVKALRTSGSGKNKRSSFVEICSQASKGPVGIEAQGHVFSAEELRLELAVHKTEAKAPKPLIPCPAFHVSDGVSAAFVEHCLLEGDAVEAWGCRSSRSGALLPCYVWPPPCCSSAGWGSWLLPAGSPGSWSRFFSLEPTSRGSPRVRVRLALQPGPRRHPRWRRPAWVSRYPCPTGVNQR